MDIRAALMFHLYLALFKDVLGEGLAVYWSMENHTDGVLLPNLPLTYPSYWEVDISSLDTSTYFREGMFGEAFYNPGKLIDWVENIRAICLHDLDECGEDGLTILFWLKVESWMEGFSDSQVIYRTTNLHKELPGISFAGSDDGTNFDVFMRTSFTGKQYEASFPRSLISDGWIHVAVIWDKESGIEVSLNGTLLTDQYTSGPSVANSTSFRASLTDFTMGSSVGPTFYIDELYIYYKKLSIDQIRDLMRVYDNSFTTIFSTATTYTATVSGTPSTLRPDTSPVRHSTFPPTVTIPNTDSYTFSTPSATVSDTPSTSRPDTSPVKHSTFPTTATIPSTDSSTFSTPDGATSTPVAIETKTTTPLTTSMNTPDSQTTSASTAATSRSLPSTEETSKSPSTHPGTPSSSTQKATEINSSTVSSPSQVTRNDRSTAPVTTTKGEPVAVPIWVPVVAIILGSVAFTCILVIIWVCCCKRSKTGHSA